MSDNHWKAISEANETVEGETYSKCLDEVKKTDTGKIWTVNYHDSQDVWTPLDQVKVVEGKVQAAHTFA
jgi:hypothetical protein